MLSLPALVSGTDEFTSSKETLLSKLLGANAINKKPLSISTLIAVHHTNLV
jgi:hypothetical protein